MKIIYKNMEIEINENDRVIDAFKEKIEENNNIIACMVNNEVKNLNYKLQNNDKIELLSTTDRDGARIYTRGLLFIMSMAFKELYPEILLTVNYQLKSSMICELKNIEPTEEMIENVRNKMQEIIDANIDIEKRELPREKAIEFLKKENTTIGKAQLEDKEKNEMSLYFCNEYYNYFFGVMPISTGFIKLFDIMKYNNGFLIRYPSKKDPNKIMPYEETKKLLRTLEEYDDIYNALGVCNLDQINKIIREGKAKELILISEALHEKKISQIADEVAKNKEKRIILIAGPSSSGKTTFAKRLGIQLRLNGIKPKTISVDNYFVEREETPLDENGKPNFEALEAVDLKLLNDDLGKLLNGEEIKMPTFNFKTGHKEYLGNTMKLEEDEVLVMEGIHCLNDNLTPAIPKEQKFKIYISALTVLNIDYYNRISTTDTRIIRRTVRDNQFRGYNAKRTLGAWSSVTAGEEKNIFPYQEQADVMFNTSLIYEINALRNYALPLFEQITPEDDEYSEAKRLCKFLKYFEPIDTEYIPKNSLLQEFLGNSIFEE
ncbi:MAG: nucleoside kinase [Clostridia bacterium]|nr:nucleoside kinase [Clostridia bacterium]